MCMNSVILVIMFKSLITEEIIASSAATLNPCSILLIYFPKSNYHRGHGRDLSELNTLVFRFIACTLYCSNVPSLQTASLLSIANAGVPTLI